MKIRPMEKRDLDAVLEIERASFPTAWLPEMFIAEMEGPVSTAVVGVENERVVGYAVYRVVMDEGHLMNIATHPALRGRGLGRVLLDYALRDCMAQGGEYMFLEVREGNAVAQKLYLSTGFIPVGRRKGYYKDTGEDAIVMEVCLRGYVKETEAGATGGRVPGNSLRR